MSDILTDSQAANFSILMGEELKKRMKESLRGMGAGRMVILESTASGTGGEEVEVIGRMGSLEGKKIRG